MKKLMLMLAAVVVTLIGLAAPSQATGGTPDADNKKVTICHATGSATNPYTKIEVSVSGWYNGHRGHADDIWQAFSYTDKSGATVTVPQQGNVNLLAFDDCNEPKQDEKIAKPEPVIVDKCGVTNDTLSVAPGRGYTVTYPPASRSIKTAVVTLEPGFVWADGSTAPITYTHTFTNVACDLPDTGVGAQQFTVAGGSALAGLALAGYMMFSSRRKQHVA